MAAHGLRMTCVSAVQSLPYATPITTFSPARNLSRYNTPRYYNGPLLSRIHTATCGPYYDRKLGSQRKLKLKARSHHGDGNELNLTNWRLAFLNMFRSSSVPFSLVLSRRCEQVLMQRHLVYTSLDPCSLLRSVTAVLWPTECVYMRMQK